MRILLLTLNLIFVSAICYPQENHNWNQQVGAVSNMIGGASTASARDNSAIFYNPGCLAFVENSSLSLVGDAYFLSTLTIKNGAGSGLDLKSRIVDTTPQIVSGIIKNKKNPDLSITYALLNRNYSFIKMNVNQEMYYNILPELEGDEIYIANYDYYNRQREDWAGIGMGHKLGKYFGIGISYFFTIRTQDLNRSYNANVIEYFENGDVSSSLASSSFSEIFEYRNVGMLWKIGVNYDKDNLKLGLTITTPKLSLGVIPGDLRRDLITRIPPLTNITPIQSTNQSKVPTVHKLPLVVDLGVEYEFGKTSVSARIGYSSKIATYSLLKAKPPSSEIQEILRPNDENFNSMFDANKALLNVGAGFIHVIKDGWAILGGFRTDFNYFDDKNLSRQENYVPSISYWDLYHVSGGFTWYGERYYLSLGLNYGAGRADGIQEINLTEPTLENNLYGVRNDSAYAKYNQFNINIGFTYLFPRL